jgi:hypothetical protein
MQLTWVERGLRTRFLIRDLNQPAQLARHSLGKGGKQGSIICGGISMAGDRSTACVPLSAWLGGERNSGASSFCSLSSAQVISPRKNRVEMTRKRKQGSPLKDFGDSFVK